jgi:hypothetical protein
MKEDKATEKKAGRVSQTADPLHPAGIVGAGL